MNILLIGNGGREHALAWALADSPMTRRLVIAPGNPGMAALGEMQPIAADDLQHRGRHGAVSSRGGRSG